MTSADDTPGEELTEENTGEASLETGEAVPPAHREPVWLLVLGILYFLSFVAVAWLPQSGRQTTPGYQESVSARLTTNMTAAILAWQLRGIIPAQLHPALRPQVAELARTSAESWDNLSRRSDDDRYAGLTALNSAALHGVAEDNAAAHQAIRRAIRIDAAHAQDYRALLPLYESPPRAVTFTTGAEAALTQISAGPIIRARNAQVAGNTPAALAALEPAARKGVRAFIAGGVSGMLVLGLLLGGLIIAIVRYSRITQAISDVSQSPPPLVPWGIGTALILITTTYLIASLGADALVRLLPNANSNAALTLRAVATPFSALLIVGLFLLAMGRRFTEWSVFGWWKTSRGVRFGLLTLVLTYPLVILATLLSAEIFRGQTEAHPLIPLIESTRNVWLLVFWVLIAVVMAPLVEETLFRGVLFRALHDRLPFWTAAVLNGVLFAIVHGQLVGILPIAILGTLFAVLLTRTGSLLAPAAAHAAFNGITMLNALLLSWALR